MWAHFADGQWVLFVLVSIAITIDALCVLGVILDSVNGILDVDGYIALGVIALICAGCLFAGMCVTANIRGLDQQRVAQVRKTYPFIEVAGFDSKNETIRYYDTHARADCKSRIIDVKHIWTLIPETTECT